MEKENIVFKLWKDFEDVPIDEDDCIDIEWHGWPKGTPKMDIWHWFDKNSPEGIAKFLNLK